MKDDDWEALVALREWNADETVAVEEECDRARSDEARLLEVAKAKDEAITLLAGLLKTHSQRVLVVGTGPVLPKDVEAAIVFALAKVSP